MPSRVAEMTPPDRFVDEQIKGPFRRFHHEHRFARNGNATLMIDVRKVGWEARRSTRCVSSDSVVSKP